MKTWVARLAIRECLNGDHISHRHGAVLESGGQILAVASNTYKTRHPSISVYSTHAEVAAVQKLKPGKIKDADLYVARISHNHLGLSRPCARCLTFLLTTEIRRVYYSIAQNEWGCIKI